MTIDTLVKGGSFNW